MYLVTKYNFFKKSKHDEVTRCNELYNEVIKCSDDDGKKIKEIRMINKESKYILIEYQKREREREI